MNRPATLLPPYDPLLIVKPINSAAIHAFVIAQARKTYAAARELEKKK
ncbi:MAG: hypothetical protein O7B81_04880 [Gammaproteobacteria bacterium]|nr:hypothetical protein [Gammaproteobacteria bacterium]